MAETSENGTPICGRRTRNCRKCGYHYSAADRELWNCPECGEDRKCQLPGTGAGGACKAQHGGKAKVGIDSPRFKHGGRSKYVQRVAGILPAHYAKLLEEIGPDVLDLTDVALVLKARFYDVVQNTNRGASQELIQEALKHTEAMDAAQAELTRLGRERAQATQAGNTAAADAAQAEIEKQSATWNQSWENVKKALRQDLQDWQSWNNAILLAEKTTRVVESQRKGLVEARLVLGVDRVEKLYTSMIQAVNDEVEDDEVIARLAQKFKTIALAGLGQDFTQLTTELEQ
jgi:hypothetical protein